MRAAGKRCIQGLMSHRDEQAEVRWHESAVSPESGAACLWWKGGKNFLGIGLIFFLLAI